MKRAVEAENQEERFHAGGDGNEVARLGEKNFTTEKVKEKK